MTQEVDRRDIPEQEVNAALPPYEPPLVVTYRDDDLLAELGPAQACSFGHSVIECAEPLLPLGPGQLPPPPGT